MTTLAFGTARECSTLLSLHPNSFLPFRWKALEHPELDRDSQKNCSVTKMQQLI
jgi:hypothetical protein